MPTDKTNRFLYIPVLMGTSAMLCKEHGITVLGVHDSLASHLSESLPCLWSGSSDVRYNTSEVPTVFKVVKTVRVDCLAVYALPVHSKLTKKNCFFTTASNGPINFCILVRGVLTNVGEAAQ